MLENNIDIVLASGPFKGSSVDYISSVVNVVAICIAVIFCVLLLLTPRIVRKTTNERKEIKNALKHIKIIMFCIYIPLGIFNTLIYNMPVNIVHDNNVIEANINNYGEAKKKVLEISSSTGTQNPKKSTKRTVKDGK